MGNRDPETIQHIARFESVDRQLDDLRKAVAGLNEGVAELRRGQEMTAAAVRRLASDRSPDAAGVLAMVASEHFGDEAD